MDKLRNMEVMVAVVEAGSFAAAARQLQISAGMGGKHIQELGTHPGARLVRPYRMVIAAAPAYLQRHGTPECAADLARHQCLSHSVWQRRVEWTLRDGDEEFFWPENARLTCNQGDGLRQAALRGLGLIMQPEVLLADDLVSGALVPVMQACLPAPRPVQLVYAPDRRQLPKLARFVEYVVGTLGVDGH